MVDQKVEDTINFVLKLMIPFFKIQQWHPVFTVISLIISPALIALTQKGTKIFTSFAGPIPVMVLISIPSFLLLIYTLYCIVRRRKPYFTSVFTLYSFFISVCALTVVCSILINFMELIQILTGANSVFLGLTVLCWANSIGGNNFLILDYLTITHFAKHGNPQTAIAGIFSGQVFNFLPGFGISLAIQSFSG